MGVLIKNTVIKEIGTIPIKVAETDNLKRATVIGMSITNVSDNLCLVNVLLEDDTSTQGYFLKDTIIPEGTSLRAVSSGEKLVMGNNNRLLVSSNRENSLDVIVSFAEIT